MTFKHKLARRLAQLRDCSMLPLLAVVWACAAGEPTATSGSDANAEGPIVINPRSVTIETGQEVVFRAYESAEVGSALVASIEWTATGGVIRADGTYSSSLTGEFKVRGKRKGNPHFPPDTSVVIVVPPQPTLTSIEISPTSTSVATGTQRTFVATGRLSDGTTVPIGVTWVATGGSIDPGGVYTAGSATGSYRVIATAASSAVADTSTVTVTAPAVERLTLSPDTVSVQGGTTHQFTVSARMSDGSTGSISATYVATGGSISSTGLFTAGSAGGTFRVIATQVGGTLADTSRVTVLAPASVPSDALGEPAARADSFWHSVGVNSHITYVGSGTYDGLGTSVWVERIRGTWIRHFRDAGLVFDDPGWMRTAYDKGKILNQEVGVKFTILMAPYRQGHDYASGSHIVKLLDYLPASAIEGWEGLNEHNASGRSNWAAEVKQWQQTLWNTVKGNPTLNRPVLGPTYTSCSADEAVGDLSPWFDFHAMHPYPGDGIPSGAIAFNISCLASGNLARKPIMATETGYTTNLAVTYHPPVSEAADAKYVPRLFLENFNAGWPRSFDYELIDDAGIGFGYFRSDGTPKPSITALSRLLKLVADSGSAYTPGRLAYSLSGDLTNVHRTLLQKRDGRFYLALWLEVPSFNGSTDQMIAVTPRNLTLQLSQPASVRVYRPNQSDAPLQQASAVSSVSLAVPDEVLVVEITR